jgi:hypothetical protein
MARNDQTAISTDSDADWLFSPRSNSPQITLFGFVTLSAITGWFFKQAILRLRHITEMSFSKADPTADTKRSQARDRRPPRGVESEEWQ